MLTSYRNKDWLQKHYQDDGWSSVEIAAFCGCGQSTVSRWLEKHGIPSRDMTDCHLGKRNGAWVESAIKDYTWLYQKYVVDKLTLREIAKESGVGLRTVARWMQEHNISRRVGSEARIHESSGESNPNWKGGSFCPNCGEEKAYTATRCRVCHFKFLSEHPEEHPGYKGIMDINTALRGAIRQEWQPKVFERDNWTCRECGNASGAILHAHHIVPYAVIRDQLLFEYAPVMDLTTPEGRRKFIDTVVSDSRVNDLDNGITLCKECHYGEHARIKENRDNAVYTYYADVVKVIDADTVRFDVDLGFDLTKRVDIRLFGVNAPELDSPEKELLARALQGKSIVELLCPPGRNLVLRTYKAEKYGRYLAFVILEHDWINRFLVRSGLAVECFGN